MSASNVLGVWVLPGTRPSRYCFDSRVISDRLHRKCQCCLTPVKTNNVFRNGRDVHVYLHVDERSEI